MAPVRAGFIIIGFFLVCFLAIPMQGAALMTSRRGARAMAQFLAKTFCRLIGIRITVKGAMVRGQSVLLASNHTSYFDILVLGSLGPVAFISKSEVKRWPIFGIMARLARTVFVERQSRAKTGRHRDMIQERLAEGDTLVLFPEGTSSDGNRVLPFKSALMGAAQPGPRLATGENGPPAIVVQPVAVAYTKVHGLPMGRQYRPLFAWYGDMALMPHVWESFAAGPLDVEVHFYPPLLASDFKNRHEMAHYCHDVVAAGLGHALAGREGLAPLAPRPAT